MYQKCDEDRPSNDSTIVEISAPFPTFFFSKENIIREIHLTCPVLETPSRLGLSTRNNENASSPGPVLVDVVLGSDTWVLF